MRGAAILAMLGCLGVSCSMGPEDLGPIPDHHVLRGSEVIGVDPITKTPAVGPDGDAYSEAEVVDLTLLQVVKNEQLVSKLRVFDLFLTAETERLSASQRYDAESSVRDWSPEDKELFFRAAAIVVESLKRDNPDLEFATLTPGREIVLPDPNTF